MIQLRGEVLYNILIESGIPMNLLRQIKMCLNETYSRVGVGKYLSDRFETSGCSSVTDFQLCFRVHH